MQLDTIGYAHKDTQATLAQFVAQGGLVVDIRLSPVTKIPGFSAQDLSALYKTSYLQLSNLGNINHHTGRDIALKNEEYGLAALDRVLEKAPTVILCGCKWVDSCHRLYVANCAQDRHPGLEVTHLLQAGRAGMIKLARAIPLGKCAYMVDGLLCPYEQERTCYMCHAPICDVHTQDINGFFTEKGFTVCPICYEKHLDNQAR